MDNQSASEIPDNCCVYVTSSENCWHFLTKAGVVVNQLVPELKCSHEEADTKVLIHVTHATHNGFAAVCLRSPDTDFTVIGISLASQVPSQIPAASAVS